MYPRHLLDLIKDPKDLNAFDSEQLRLLAHEIRTRIINVVKSNGGHLAASLGVVELTIALLQVFPGLEDRIIWDVGHQAYAHKILTGRNQAFHTLRQFDGISGFPKMEESPYDAFTTGHSSTSISVGLGMAIGKRLRNQSGRIISVIGDGALTAGLAFEGLNQAGYLDENLIVVLNDNGMSIAPNVGALSKLAGRTFSGKTYQSLRRRLATILKSVPKIGDELYDFARRSEESLKALSTPGILFEAFHFNYVGPVDGHDIDNLAETFRNILPFPGPFLVHVMTQKGRGYAPAENDPISFHGVTAPYVVEPEHALAPTYSKVFGGTMVDLASQDERVVAITAAMTEGTGLLEFAQTFPLRFFDVGIAEQHAVTMAAGLATQGLRPIVAIYSTFAQRALDQILHDVCLSNLPVIFALDRSGIVGEDGSTHQGLFDLSFLRMIPNLCILAPANENELSDMLYTALQQSVPVAIRYPKGKALGLQKTISYSLLPWGKSEVCQEGDDILFLAVGNMLCPALEAAEMLDAKGIRAAVINVRFIKPLDSDLILAWAKKCGKIITLEENVLAGGFGSCILELLSKERLNLPVIQIGIGDIFVEQGSQQGIRKLLGLTSEDIVNVALRACTDG